MSHPPCSPPFSYTLSPSTLAYVTYQDLHTISNFKEQTVIAMKAPPETQLEVPDFSEVCVGPGAVSPACGRVRAGVWVLLLHLRHP